MDGRFYAYCAIQISQIQSVLIATAMLGVAFISLYFLCIDFPNYNKKCDLSLAGG